MTPPVYIVTSFREWNVIKLHHEDRDFLHKLTYREVCVLSPSLMLANPHIALQLRKETKILNDLLREIREDIRHSGNRYSDLATFEDIPHVVRTS